MRFGLVGTGPWARAAHAPALVSTDGVELVGVWGRTPDKADALASTVGVRAFPTYEALLAEVDAVAFAVPPDVQVALAMEAARAGRHLLLDKPVATSAAQARELEQVASAQEVASVVFFTDRFSDGGASWIDTVSRSDRWLGGDVRWLSALDTPGNPYAESTWRRERGALWDIGPHALAILVGALGPVTDVRGVAGAGDLVHLVLRHGSGATSTATLSLFAPAAAVTQEVWLWGEEGSTRMPPRVVDGAVPALSRAVTALRESARSGVPHPADLRLGADVVELLELVQGQLSQGFKN